MPLFESFTTAIITDNTRQIVTDRRLRFLKFLCSQPLWKVIRQRHSFCFYIRECHILNDKNCAICAFQEYWIQCAFFFF
jgi:hypothetical protein